MKSTAMSIAGLAMSFALVAWLTVNPPKLHTQSSEWSLAGDTHQYVARALEKELAKFPGLKTLTGKVDWSRNDEYGPHIVRLNVSINIGSCKVSVSVDEADVLVKDGLPNEPKFSDIAAVRVGDKIKYCE